MPQKYMQRRRRRHKSRPSFMDKAIVGKLDGWDLLAAFIIAFLVLFLVFVPLSGFLILPTARASSASLSVVSTESTEPSPTANVAQGHVSGAGGVSVDGKRFDPTYEWQEVEEGQSIPGGLDVRMDLESGKSFARILPGTRGEADTLENEAAEVERAAAARLARAFEMEREREKAMEDGDADLMRKVRAAVREQGHHGGGDKSGKEGEKDVVVETKEAKYSAEGMSEIRRLMLSLPEPEPDVQAALDRGLKGAELDKVLARVWEKRQRELREAFSSAKSEADQMKEKLKRIADAGNSADKEQVLTRVSAWLDLETLAMSWHNAKDLAGMGGIELAVQFLNSSTPMEAAVAARVLGALVKHEPEHQERALVSGAVPLLVRLARRALEEQEDGTVVWKADEAASRAIFALGALMRRHAGAQTQVVQLEGHILLADLAVAASKSKEETLARPAVSKIVKIIRDLADEALRRRKHKQPESQPQQDAIPITPLESSTAKPQHTSATEERRKLLRNAWTGSHICNALAQSVLHSSVLDMENTVPILHAMAVARRPCTRALRENKSLRETLVETLTELRQALLDRRAEADAVRDNSEHEDSIDGALDAFHDDAIAADAARDAAAAALLIDAFA